MNEEKKPRMRSLEAQTEIEKCRQRLDAFEEQVKELTLDRLNQTPKAEEEPQTKLSSKQIEKSKDIYLKPERSIGSKEKFNEKFREEYNFAKEYVQFIAENKEIIGEAIEIWTKPFPGMPAEYWKVPTNKPIWGPRYLAEQIKRKYYHRLVMQSNVLTNSDGMGQYYGTMAADTTIQRLNAEPVNTKKSVFMGAANF
jgi:hypothetical protein